jgi:hypothetical protein
VIDEIEEDKADAGKPVQKEVRSLIVDVFKDGRCLNGCQKVAFGKRGDKGKTGDVEENEEA